MRRTGWIVGATLLGFVGCVQMGRVRTTLDVRALLDPEVRAGDYVIPAGTPELQRRTEPMAVDVASAMRGDLEAVGFRFAIGFAHQQGRAAASVRLYAASSADTVFAGEPLMELHGGLEPGLERRLARDVEASERLLEVVRAGKLYCGTEVRWRASADAEITGSYEIMQLELTLVTAGGNMLGSAAPPQPTLVP
jgi:hypothetical protein